MNRASTRGNPVRWPENHAAYFPRLPATIGEARDDLLFEAARREYQQDQRQ